MRLLRVTVGGFRNVGETTMELNGLTALVSPNNYGKSNLLDAIAFGIGFLGKSPRGRSAMMGSASCVPLVPALAQADFRFRVEFEGSGYGRHRLVRYGYSFSWSRGAGCGQTITGETIEFGTRSGGWTTYLRRVEGKLVECRGRSSLRSIRLDGAQLAIDVVGAFADNDIAHVVANIRRIGFVLCPSIDDPLRLGRMSCGPGRGDGHGLRVGLDDSDLPRAMYDLRVNHRERFDDLITALHTLFPELEDVSVRPFELRCSELDAVDGQTRARVGAGDAGDAPFKIRDERYRMTVRCASLNQPVDVAMMSAGTRRVIRLLATVAVVGEHPGAHLVAIEDLEASVSPSVLGRLSVLLGGFGEGVSLLATSHSPLLTRHIDPRRVYLGRPADAGVARFRRMRGDEVENVSSHARDRGLGLAEYLFELMGSAGDGSAMLSRVLEE